jgi:phage terminase large subunit
MGFVLCQNANMDAEPQINERELRGGAAELYDCQDRQVLIEGPAGTGKTEGALEKMDHLCWQYPGCRCLVVRKVRRSLNESVLFKYENHVLTYTGAQIIKAGPSFEHRSAYQYPNGSRVVLGGLDKDNVTRVMSTDYDWILFVEATEGTLNDWENLITRLRNYVMPFQQAIAECNPAQSTHWLNVRASTGNMRRLYSRHVDNPLLHDGTDWTREGREYMETLKQLSGVRRERLLFGRWASVEGAVFPEWDPAIHVVEPFEIPEDWARFRCVDFGFTNPFVCLWVAQDHDGRLFVYREYRRCRTQLAEHAARIADLSGGERYELGVCDSESPQEREELRSLGLTMQPAKKGPGSVKRGIDMIRERLSPAGDGRPRLFVVRGSLVEVCSTLSEQMDPLDIVQELEGYHYPVRREGRPEDEQPVKEHDHGIDALRYLVARLDRPGGRVSVIEPERGGSSRTIRRGRGGVVADWADNVQWTQMGGR